MKKTKSHYLLSLCLPMIFLLSLVSCAPGKKEPEQTFAQAHDSFETKLTQQNHESYEVPAPPEGVFDLVQYPSKVGDLAAYVSSDPEDGQKHPLIIWIVGGWGNSIDEFPWSYASWDNDQTGSAFWEAGVLTMYPSFRGGNNNPGYFETLFGEVDDIVSAYEYAASLPYVDPERIYLGGHSTGGTRALLAAEYTDRFRAVFCFGAVDEIKYHNNTQFTFDQTDPQESVMRSPIYWLQDIKSPTFLIEGIDGNSSNLKKIQEKSTNENIQCFILDNADHFSTLAPVTELLSQKILQDTGDTSNITLTQEELKTAMAQPAKEPEPLMVKYQNYEMGLSIYHPFGWGIDESYIHDEVWVGLQSEQEGENVWDLSTVYVGEYPMEETDDLEAMGQSLQADGYSLEETAIGKYPAILANGIEQQESGDRFSHKILLVQKENSYMEFDFYIHESFGDIAEPLFQKIIDSIRIR